MAETQHEENCFASTLHTIIVGGGIILFLLWWNRKKEKKALISEAPEAETYAKSDGFVQDFAPGPSSRRQTADTATQTDFFPESDIKWKSVFVGGEDDDLTRCRHRSELRVDFATGDVTRNEEVIRTTSNYILTKIN